MFYKSYSKCEVRPFDHLYDPLYTSGTQRDIQRKNEVVLKRTAAVEVLTNYNSMFCETEQQPTYVIRKNPLPFIPPPQSYHKSDSERNQTNNPIKRLNTDGFVRAYTATNRESKLNPQNIIEGKINEIQPFRRTSHAVGCQTIYREQSAQTKPYFPDIRYNDEYRKLIPEFHLKLSEPIYKNLNGNTFAERKRKEFMDTLLKDGKNLGNTEEINEFIEWERWLSCEHDFERNQMLRQQMVEYMLSNRMNTFSQSSTEAIEHAIERSIDMRKVESEEMLKRYERSMRKLKNFVSHQSSKTLIMEFEPLQQFQHSDAIKKNGLKPRQRSNSFDEIINTAMESRIQNLEHLLCERSNFALGIAKKMSEDDSLRAVHESMKAHRLKQAIHTEITKHLIAIDKLRTLETKEDLKVRKIDENKRKISGMLSIAMELKELMAQMPYSSVDSSLELLMHKLNQILTKNNIEKLLSHDTFEYNAGGFDFDRSVDSSLEKCFETVYLDNLLEICEHVKNKSKDEILSDTDEKSINSGISPFDIDEHKLKSYSEKPREQITVNLEELTREERDMIFSLSNECVEKIFDNLQNE